jgi:glycosyltransferase involved in cell wall biosynthesis
MRRPPGTSFRLVVIGRLTEIKGQDVLIEAVGLLQRGPLMVELTVVGDGPMRAELEARCVSLGIAERVRFVGAQGDVLPYLHSADLFVLPSRSEGVSVALLEAMAAGLPVVATRVGGTPEVTGPGMGAILVSPDDPHALAEGIHTMIASNALAVREGQAARRRVEAAFSLERTHHAYAKCYGLDLPTHTSAAL